MTLARWRMVLWLLVTVAVLWTLVTAWSALVPFAVGGVIGYALLPVVERLAALLPVRSEGLRRTIAVLLVYLVFGGAFGYAMWVLVPILAGQVTKFVEAVPGNVEAINQSLSHLFEEYRARVPESTQAQVESYLQGAGDTVGRAISASVQQSVQIVTGTVSILFGYFVVPFWLFYMLKDRPSLQRGMLHAAPPSLRDDLRHASLMVDHVVGRYIRAQLFLGLVVGAAVGVSMSLLGVELAAGLGVWAGLTELVPIIGPWIGAVPGLLIVAATEPSLLLPVGLVYFMVQQLENQLLVPRLQGEATDIPAGIVILLLVVGGAAFGFVGLVVAVPAGAILRELFWYLDRRLRGASAGAAFAESRAARDGHNHETAPVIAREDAAAAEARP